MSSDKKNGKRVSKRKMIGYILLGLLIIWILVSIYSRFYPLPKGINVEGQIYNVSEGEIEFLHDLNYLKDNQTVIEQEIFDNVFEMIRKAEKFIVIDMFLFNTDYSENVRYKNLTTDMKNLLIKQKKSNPELKVFFITDPINNFYGSYTSDELKEMKDAGIEVVITDLNKMRDLNFVYAGLYRAYFQWFGTSGKGWINHLLGNSERKVTLRSVLKLMNTKANHRKVIIADAEKGSEVYTIVTSANPHEASSKHSNIGILIKKGIWKDVLDTEKAVAEFSGSKIDFDVSKFSEENNSGNIQVQLFTEGKIRENLVKDIDSLEAGEELEIAMFYFSDRKIIRSILGASERGVEVRLILDPNKDAFAREKNGVPNRPAAFELVKKSKGKIKIRWYDTQGEQFHSKMIILRKSDGSIIVYLGSANLTKRNIGNFNLEMNVKVSSPEETILSKEIEDYFEMLWENKLGDFTADFSKYEDSSRGKYLLYRFQEATGFSSF